MARKKLETFWYYNKWLVIGGAALLVLIVHLVTSIIFQEKEAFSAIFLNCVQREEESTMSTDFATFAGIDEDSGKVVFNSSIELTPEGTEQNIQAFQTILAYIAAGELDIIGATQDTFTLYSYNTSNIFTNLREYLSPEQLQALDGNIFYIDRAFETAILEHMNDADFFENLEYPDPFFPEKMEEPIPIGIEIGSCKPFLSSYSSGGEAVYIGIVSNAPHADLAVQLIHYLYEGSLLR